MSDVENDQGGAAVLTGLQIFETLQSQQATLDALPAQIAAQVAEALANKPQLLYTNATETLIGVPGLYLSFPPDQMNHALSYLDPMFDRGLIHCLAHALVPGATYIDVGANVGTLVGLAARNVGQAGQVIAVEPIAALKESIARNAFLNGPLTPFVCHSLAIGDYEGDVEFQRFKADHRISTIYPYQTPEKTDLYETYKVPIKPLSGLVPAGESDLVIKIDAEGAEYAILANLLENSANLKGRKTTLILEYGNEHLLRAGTSPETFLALLDQYSLTAHFIHPASGVMSAQLSAETAHLDGNVALIIAPGHL